MEIEHIKKLPHHVASGDELLKFRIIETNLFLSLLAY